MSSEIQQNTLYPKQRAFLKAYSLSLSITHSAEAAGINRLTHYDWMRSDENYRQAFAIAKQEGASLLLDEAVRRAKDGVMKPVLYKGQPVMMVNPQTGKAEMLIEREFSDSLMNKLLAGLMPETFGDRTQLAAAPGSEFTVTVRSVLDKPET